MDQILKVNMLGEFSITYGSKIINDQTNRSKKVWTLLKYLITFRDREISQDEIIELLWPDDEVSDPLNTLKTLLYRVRLLIQELGFEDTKKIIVYKGGTYAWDPPLAYTVDTDQFEKMCQRAYSSDSGKNEKIDNLLEAIKIYKGDFLPNNALDPWAVPINIYYHSQYVQAVRTVINLLGEEERYSEILPICQKAIVIDPYEEHFHYYLIKAFVETGKQKEALKHYDYVNNLFFSKFGITPSKELTALYKQVVKTSKSIELDLNVIKERFHEQESATGCFFCEYEFFKNLYQLQARSAARTGQAVCLCLLTMTDINGEKPAQKVLNLNMAKLKEIIHQSLRKGDVFTRYSVSQYLIMLPMTTYESSDMVMRRIERTFRRNNPKAPVMLRYSLQPLTPLECLDKNGKFKQK